MTRSLPVLLAILLAVALPATRALAQDAGSVAGKVSDKRTGHAIPFATVTIVGAQKGALTDSEGRFLVTGIPAGTYEVRVQFLGYAPSSTPGVVVAGGKSATVNIGLEEVVVSQEKTIEVTAERKLVEVKQGATVRSVDAAEIRNLPVQTLTDVLQRQAGINAQDDQIHVRGGRADETIFVVNGVANRDLVTGQSTAGQLNARSVAEVNVATGAYDVRYGNALSGVVEVRLKEGSDRFSGGVTARSGSFGGRSLQLVAGGPDPIWMPNLRRLGLRLPGTMSSIIDVSGTFSETRFNYLGETGSLFNFTDQAFNLPERRRLSSGYEDSFLGKRFKYGDFWSPAQDNRWAARYGLTWKPNNRDKWTFNVSKRLDIDQGFSRTFITATGDQGDPAFPWRWSNRLAHGPTILEDNQQSSLQWRRTLGTTGWTEFQVSRFFFAQHQDVMGKHWSEYEEPDDRSNYPVGDPRRDDFFIDSGDDNTWQDRRSTTYGVQWSLLQRLGRHEVEFGFEHDFQSVQYVTIDDPWVFDPDGLGGAHDLWKVHPWVGALYLRDKLEYEGFTANVGLRADYWFTGREAERALADTANRNVSPETRDAFFDDTYGFFGRRYKLNLSPRVIVAHPITESSSFFFNYGQFTQNPSYRYVYSKLTSVSSESFPLLGNPNLNPQVSVNYEVGAKHQFWSNAAINATFFVKDIYDYPTATTFRRTQGASLVDIFVYLNGHFARAKGFEIEVEKRRSNFWSGKLSYTFQQTKGKSSDPNEQKIVQSGGGDASETRLSETFVRWNRPHKLTGSLDVRFNEDAPLGFLNHTGFNLFVIGQSGRAYTPETILSTQSAEPFSNNAPFQMSTDLRINRRFFVAGRKFDIGAAVTNLFNEHRINRVDNVTGRGRVWGEGEYDPLLFPEVAGNEFIRVGQVNDPSNYGPGREWRFSLDYDF
jgi:outer membrane receptor protein involved in Fe transport